MTPLTKPPFIEGVSRAVVPSLTLLSQNTHYHETAEVGPKSCRQSALPLVDARMLAAVEPQSPLIRDNAECLLRYSKNSSFVSCAL